VSGFCTSAEVLPRFAAVCVRERVGSQR
jgi:hypothetical protein